jgi:NAD(P)-dependent dehydrogenase (short-subunit alcohol dehydrogenase family)
MDRAKEQWVVVSGAGGVLGRSLAAHFAAAGSKVLALDREFSTEPTGVATRTVDLALDSEVQQALSEAIPATEPIALLVNAVGMIWNEPVLALRGARFSTHSLESWHKVINANLTAAFVTATQVATRMARRGGGSIVNFSSIASEGNPGQAAYGAAKAGIEGLTRSMALELGPLGIRVNALALGFIDVATTRSAVPEEKLRSYIQKTSLGRLGRVEDVIEAIEFLAAGTFTSGTVMRLDGGLRL